MLNAGYESITYQSLNLPKGIFQADVQNSTADLTAQVVAQQVHTLGSP
jgi:hypothetical protein